MDRSTRNVLGKRAVTCDAWRWLPGMLTHTTVTGGLPALPAASRWRVGQDPEADLQDLASEGMIGCGCLENCGDGPSGMCESFKAPPPLPDLSDSATLGCLLALVREAWNDSLAHVWVDYRTGRWTWMARGQTCSIHSGGEVYDYDTEAEALVAALEAAPRSEGS